MTVNTTEKEASRKRDRELLQQLRSGMSLEEINFRSLIDNLDAKEAKRKEIAERIELTVVLLVVLAIAAYLILQDQGLIQ